jgi:hypothetical protein
MLCYKGQSLYAYSSFCVVVKLDMEPNRVEDVPNAADLCTLGVIATLPPDAGPALIGADGITNGPRGGRFACRVTEVDVEDFSVCAKGET